MFNFTWPFKFWLDSPLASAVPVISMKEAVPFVLEYPNVDTFVKIQIWDRKVSHIND